MRTAKGKCKAEGDAAVVRNFTSRIRLFDNPLTLSVLSIQCLHRRASVTGSSKLVLQTWGDEVLRSTTALDGLIASIYLP